MVGINPAYFAQIGLSHVWLAQGCTCFYCQRPLSLRQATRDHLLPRSNGHTLVCNVVAACYACNKRKGSNRPSKQQIERARIVMVNAGLPAFGVGG